MVDGVLIYTAHLHPMGNGCLLQQTPAGWRSRSQQEHHDREQLGKTMALVSSDA